MSQFGAAVGMLLAGASAAETEEVTVSSAFLSGVTYYGYKSGSGAFGTIDDGVFAKKGGASVAILAWGAGGLFLGLDGPQSNDGWTSMTVGGQTFLRSAASFASGTPSQWSWSAMVNPFGTTLGAVKDVVFQ